MATNRAPPQRFTVVMVVAAVAVVLAAVAMYFSLTRDGGDDGAASGSSTAATPVVPGLPPETASSSPESTPGSPTTGFAYQPLWPFAGDEDAAAWQRAYREGGHQPWRLDAATIAVMFTQQYLGYRNVDKAVTTDVRGEQAWVSVGFDNPGGRPAVAAVLHLARIGAGGDAPWEVVGSEDSTLTVTGPAYGSTVRSPVAASGRITGVDESLRVQLRRVDAARPVGEVAGIAAGGTDSPWQATVPFTATCPGTLTLAVSTGGHIAEVERFAVTGVRC
ncbi:Gmad2 immunoglobulin-like domain-containing protein [Nocardia sp. NRRL WC-3656]|uniref:Gmad2 immunoglobulin-like domain-containing protein n=1 Tax=Nocardia sp. NRRL WC-3656 TaxID=1463824 RepID=UPI001E502DD1|nr:Gmad2 immunoglobulin-like domain-containing protein [Nocardia sp. NRRL WC-3656]